MFKVKQQNYEQLLQTHNTQVSHIASQVFKFKESKTPFRIYHGSTNSTRPTVRKLSTSIDVSSLKNILHIDVDQKLAIVEPNVPMDDLVRACLLHGLVPPVVPEFPGITVGGGFAGTAGESSSFRYGFLDATVRNIEIVTADGRVVEASPGYGEEQGHNEDLFYGAAGTLGTMGVLTRLDLSLIPAKSHVELTYTPISSFTEAVDAIQNAVQQATAPNSVAGLRNDFIEGIMYSSTKGAVLTGKMVDISTIRAQEQQSKAKIKTPIVKFSRRWDDWYYLHVQKRISCKPPAPIQSTTAEKSASSPDSSSSPKPDEAAPPAAAATKDLIPLQDYLFRYDRGGFWVGRLAFRYFQLPFIRPLRMLFDGHLHTRVMYHALHASGLYDNFIVEDLAVPLAAPAVSLLNYVHANLAIFPLWLCPLRLNSMGLAPTHIAPHAVLLNVGVWGDVPRRATFEAANREIELKVAQLGGTKWLYAHTFYTEDEFWSIYDRKRYDAVREKWGATYLPSVWDKVRTKVDSPASEASGERAPKQRKLSERVKNFWIFPALYGLLKATTSREYILKKA